MELKRLNFGHVIFLSIFLFDYLLIIQGGMTKKIGSHFNNAFGILQTTKNARNEYLKNLSSNQIKFLTLH